MKKDLLKPKVDVVFHALFREENKRITEGLIGDILGEPVKIISNQDRYLNIKNPREKLGIMDLRTELEGGTKCNVEVQIERQKYEIERILYYWANAYSRQLMRGEKYSELKKTISIIIIDHELEKLKEMKNLGTKWQIRDNETGKTLLTDQLEIVIISIPNAKKRYKENGKDRIGQWMIFFDEPNSKEVEGIMQENEDIKEAAEKLREMSEEYTLRRVAELREKGERDYNSAIADAKEDGIAEGEARGEARGRALGKVEGEQNMKIEMAKKMLESGIPVEKIVEITGLTEEKIKAL